jgi:LmbE family N-acetylglucosaminyl deacetylase
LDPLVTCTNGELGNVKDTSLRLNPRHHPPDRQALAQIRRSELAKAAAILGITHLYTLGYHDSGMQGWDTNRAPWAFAQADPQEAIARLVGIIRRHCPEVVVTYDANGGYGHPDHIMTHRIAVAAVDAAAHAGCCPEAGTPWQVHKLYYTAWARSEVLRTFRILQRLGRKTPLCNPDFNPDLYGCPDALITTRIDVRPVMRRKWQALFTHHSQMGRRNFLWWFLRLTGPWLYAYESFCCVRSLQPIQQPETDIFAGL